MKMKNNQKIFKVTVEQGSSRELMVKTLTDQILKDKEKNFRKNKKINYLRIVNEEAKPYTYRELKEFNRILFGGKEYFERASMFAIKQKAIETDKSIEYWLDKFKKNKSAFYNDIIDKNDVTSKELIGDFYELIEQVPDLFFNKLAIVIDCKNIKDKDCDYLYFLFNKIDNKFVVSIYGTKNGFGSSHVFDFITYKIENKYYYFSIFSSKEKYKNLEEDVVVKYGRHISFLIYTLLDINKKFANRSYTREYISSSSMNTSSSTSNSSSKPYTRKTIYKLDDLLNTKIYINNKEHFRLPRKYERHTDAWNVMGYYRHYKKSGKVVFIKPHTRGNKSKNIIGRTIKLS